VLHEDEFKVLGDIFGMFNDLSEEQKKVFEEAVKGTKGQIKFSLSSKSFGGEYDVIPEEELRKSCKSFIGTSIYLGQSEQDLKRAPIGKVIDARYEDGAVICTGEFFKEGT